MLPTTETVNPNTPVGENIHPRRQETNYIAEAYRTSKVDSKSSGVSERTSAVAEIHKRGQSKAKPKTDTVNLNQDQVELNFSLSHEERDAFISVFSGKQAPATMTEEEKDTLQKASERISKYVEEAIAKNKERREHIELAVSEWYARISKGDRQEPMAFINLLRAAAMGDLDELGK